MQTQTGIVYKYFDLVDGFIRVRMLPEVEGIPLSKGQAAPPDRRHYRRLVIRHCIVEPAAILARVKPSTAADQVTAEDLLYQISIDVNPFMEIHSVHMTAPVETAALDAPETEEESAGEVGAAQFQDLEKNILSEVFGQDAAVHAICQAVKKSACGLADPKRPVGTFLLVGRTGCGKTELAKSLARNLHGAQSLIRVDCSEYALPHEIARLTGAPPGYVGHNDGGLLTAALQENPQAVVLFDEVEKGHEKLHHLLLQILDEGQLTDSKGNVVDFRQSVVLLTSNVGTGDYQKAANRLGFNSPTISQPEFEDLTKAALEQTFRPEFINRLDGVLTFQPLNQTDCTRIAIAQLERFSLRMKRAKVHLKWTASVPKHLAEEGFHEEYGAREIHRKVAELIENPLSDAFMDGSLKPGDRLTLRCIRQQIQYQRKAA